MSSSGVPDRMNNSTPAPISAPATPAVVAPSRTTSPISWLSCFTKTLVRSMLIVVPPSRLIMPLIALDPPASDPAPVALEAPTTEHVEQTLEMRHGASNSSTSRGEQHTPTSAPQLGHATKSGSTFVALTSQAPLANAGTTGRSSARPGTWRQASHRRWSDAGPRDAEPSRLRG